jgi:uncharacterized protein involved in cysteine biosynthesis
MRTNDWHVLLSGVVIVLAVIGLAALIVIRFSSTTPVITATVLVAVATVLAAVPPIIKSLRGRQ